MLLLVGFVSISALAEIFFLGNLFSDKFREFPFSGAIAQLVEHLLCKQGVMGSSPVSSSFFDRGRACFYCACSSKSYLLPGRSYRVSDRPLSKIKEIGP